MEASAVEVRLRRKNQLTLPEAIAEQLGVQPGDRLLMTIDERQPNVIRMRPIRESYAGAAVGIYGTVKEAAEYVRSERESWDG